MTQNNNLSVLPFYDSIDEQNHRKSYAYGQVYPLYTPKDKLLPFQFMIEHDDNAFIGGILLYKKDGTVVGRIETQMNETGLQIVKLPQFGYDIVVYPGNFQMPGLFKPGMYYISIDISATKRYFSDVFTVVNDISGYLKIQWNDVENLVFDAGQIIYKNPAFHNVLYLCTELGKPEYVFDEEGETRDGYFFAEKQISEKTYKFTALATEYLCDVMRFIRMSDYVIITDKYGRTYNCDTFLMTPKWETQGDIASVECEFQTATVVKKIGQGVTQPNGGDFNNDFNNDYNNQENG